MKLKLQIMQLTKQKQYPAAKKIALKLAKSLPKDIEVWFALAQLQERVGEYEQAVRSYYQVCQGPSPVFEEALAKSVQICWDHKLYNLGIAPARELIKLRPESSDIFFFLGSFWFELKTYLEAKPYLLKAAELAPENCLVLNYCGQMYGFLGEPEKGMVFFDKIKTINPEDTTAHSCSMITYNYMDGMPEQKIFEAHRAFGQMLEHKYSSPEPFTKPLSPRPKRLKIAYISQDFKTHSVAYFFKAIAENFSRDKFELTCYSDVEKPDEVTEYFKGLSDHWCDSHSMTHEVLHQQIRDDEIDILVDLIGYAGGCRVDVFARMAAPLQITYLGYPNTTGFERMDYRITDEWTDPSGKVEKLYTEKLERLPGGFLCFTPSENAPDVSELPALKEGAKGLCFGSFNAFQKISPRLYKLWASVLLAVPDSYLYIKAKPLHEPALCERVWGVMEEMGVPRARVELVGWAENTASHLDLYSKVDIHLDSFPYNGTTTICEALWQGVPVISLKGEAHRTRVGYSILSQVGLESFVASDEQEYVDIAVKKAADLSALSELRQGLRDRMRNSTLLDSSRFIRELEDAYERMWQQKSSEMKAIG